MKSDLDELVETKFQKAEQEEVLPKMEETAVDYEETPFFYFVICNKIRAKFFPSLFARGEKHFYCVSLDFVSVSNRVGSGSMSLLYRNRTEPYPYP